MKTYKYLGITVLLCVIGMIGIMAFGVARGDKGTIPKVNINTIFNKMDKMQSNRKTTPAQKKEINDLLRKHDMMQFKGK